MSNFKTILILLGLLVFWLLVVFFAGLRDAEGAEAGDAVLVDRMADGFVRMLRAEGGGDWYDCGEPTPRGEWRERARRMAKGLVTALDEYEVHASPWGAWATIYKESRGNRCAIGPNPRKAAAKLGVDKDWRLWTEDDVLGVVTSPRWGRRTADLGLGQVVWRRYARIRQDGRLRVPTASEMLSHDVGLQVLACGLRSREFYRRVKEFRGRPWVFWPGSTPSWQYHAQIVAIVNQMGGPSL